MQQSTNQWKHVLMPFDAIMGRRENGLIFVKWPAKGPGTPAIESIDNHSGSPSDLRFARNFWSISGIFDQ